MFTYLAYPSTRQYYSVFNSIAALYPLYREPRADSNLAEVGRTLATRQNLAELINLAELGRIWQPDRS